MKGSNCKIIFLLKRKNFIMGNSNLNVKIVVVSLLIIVNISRFHSYTKSLIERLILEKFSLA